MHIHHIPVSISELNQISLMSKLTRTQLSRIQKSVKMIRLVEDECLFYQNEKAYRFYLLRTGQIKLLRITPDGNQRVVDIIQPGQVIAENVLFLETGRYPYSAHALVNTELLAFNFDTFMALLNESRETCFKLLSSMSMSLHQVLDQVDYLTLQNARIRLISYLLRQIPMDQKDDNSCAIRLTAPKSVIASWLSIKPETLSRLLGTLKAGGLIKVKGKTILLNNIDKLKEMSL